MSTPTALKAFLLKFVELLHLLDTGQYPRSRTKASRAIRTVGKALRLRRRGSSAVSLGLDKGALHAQARDPGSDPSPTLRTLRTLQIRRALH